MHPRAHAHPSLLHRNTHCARRHCTPILLDHKKATPKRKTVQLTLWIEPIVKRELQRIAQAEGLTVSKTGVAFLKQALQHTVDMHYGALLTPIIEAAIDNRMRARDTRLAWLLVRVAFASEQTRAITTNILGRQQGMTEDILKTILAMSQRTAKGNITRKTPQLTELMEAVEQWLANTEKEPAPARHRPHAMSQRAAIRNTT